MESYTYIHDPIEVKVQFVPNKKPIIKEFVWKGTTYKVTDVNLVVKANKGEEKVWMFHVSNSSAAYELRLDTSTLQWWLEQVTYDPLAETAS